MNERAHVDLPFDKALPSEVEGLRVNGMGASVSYLSEP